MSPILRTISGCGCENTEQRLFCMSHTLAEDHVVDRQGRVCMHGEQFSLVCMYVCIMYTVCDDKLIFFGSGDRHNNSSPQLRPQRERERYHTRYCGTVIRIVVSFSICTVYI